MSALASSEPPVLAASTADGLQQASRSELAELTRQALSRLDDRHRMVLALRFYEEMSHAEIAATVGATPKAVETRIYRAREKLRGALKRWV